jgi:pyrrolidone-carboxylate peptidase
MCSLEHSLRPGDFGRVYSLSGEISVFLSKPADEVFSAHVLYFICRTVHNIYYSTRVGYVHICSYLQSPHEHQAADRREHYYNKRLACNIARFIQKNKQN